MTKILTWINKSKYQWDSQYLHRLFDKGFYALYGVIILSLIIICITNLFIDSKEIVRITGLTISMITGVSVGFVFTIRYIDEKLKK